MLIQANALHLPIASETVQTVVTSPPYWGLRDYGTARWSGGEVGCDHLGPPVRTQAGFNARYFGKEFASDKQGEEREPMRSICTKCGALRIDSQLGLERTPEEYVAKMVAVFREVWRVLKTDGTIWVNLGDSYATSGTVGTGGGWAGENAVNYPKPPAQYRSKFSDRKLDYQGLKAKDLCGIPWRIAFALQADGWYLRSDIIWSKPNPMPESVTDRPTKAHEYLFLLAKSERYFYDADAIREQTGSELTVEEWKRRKASTTESWYQRKVNPFEAEKKNGKPDGGVSHPLGRNRRTVWTIPTQPWSGAHFATFPENLVEPCILAGSRPGDLVLDPFVGSGTVLRVATKFQRRGVGCDISLDYLAKQADKRTRNVQVQMVWEESAG